MLIQEYEQFMQLPVEERKTIVSQKIDTEFVNAPHLNYLKGWETIMPFGVRRQLFRDRGLLDILLQQLVAAENSGNHSSKFLEQTPAQFFKTIDAAFAARGVLPIKIIQLQNTLQNSLRLFKQSNTVQSELDYDKALYRIQAYSHVVVEDLTVAGYTHMDLTAELVGNVSIPAISVQITEEKPQEVSVVA